MPTAHQVSSASKLYFGDVYYARFTGKPATGGYTHRRGVPFVPIYVHDFGAPAAAVSNGISASQSVSAGAAFLINGSLASGGVATFDVPRNVVAGWTTASILTIVGTDEYGERIVETSASGTSHAGKKAFKTITSVTSSASITLATVGSGDVLGLPYRVDINGLLAARASNAIDAGTFVPADTTNPATGTTGDVRGTFDPAVALNASNRCRVMFQIADPDTKIGAFGVTQFGS